MVRSKNVINLVVMNVLSLLVCATGVRVLSRKEMRG